MTDVVASLRAGLADRYSIERELGQGGMATVYLAQDLKHDRKVALKVLKPELAAVLGAERFVVEIKTTASLSHPHILPLFDSGTVNGFLFYVMPYVEGETLRDKLNRETQFSVDEAVRIATEVADALDYAHRHGVIHRDIKPENILLHDGRPMVADFGIALAVSAAAGGRMTETGLSLGTPHYMSPEQATADKDITGRSDIYSLASVLYEMLAGNPPHTGSTAQQIIMKIIAESAAPVTQFRKSVPPHVAAALAQALEKVPADRFATAAEFAAAINGRGATRSTRTGAAAGVHAPTRTREAVFAAVTIASLALAAWAIATRGSDKTEGERVEFAIRMGTGLSDRPHVAISPDGRRVVQIVTDSTGGGQLGFRELGSTKVTLLAGTAGAQDAAYSLDGKTIAFVSQSSLWKIPADGGPSILVADTVNGGVAWMRDGGIIFTREYGGLHRIAAAGGTPEQLTTLDTARKEFAHWNPQVLPGERTAIFNSFSTPIARSRIEAVDLASGRRTVLVERAVYARYATSGHLLFARDAALFAVPFDARNLKVLGPEVPVVEDLAWAATDAAAGYAISENGTLVYLKASEWSVSRRVVWVDRDGNEKPAMAESGIWAEPRLSPDGRWIAITRMEPTRHVWLFDRSRQVLSQATRTEGVAFNPVWTPDSRSLIVSFETPAYDLLRVPIDGSRPDTLVSNGFDKYASSVSPDGRTLLFYRSISGDQLHSMPLSGGVASPFGSGEAQERNASYSPDGRWVAFEEIGPNGEPEVYVSALRGTGGRRQVSARGGSEPRWTKGGREIVFRNIGAMMAAPFAPSTGEPGAPVLLFSKSDRGRLGSGRTVGYDVTPDGSQFLMVMANERREALPTIVVLNWLDELKRKVPR